MAASGSSALNLNVFALALCLSLTVLGVGWGCERREAENEFRALSETRVKALAQKLGALNEVPQRLDDLVAAGLVSADDLKDGWGNALLYDERTREVVSLGADGLEGGDGFGKDIRCKVGAP